MRITSAPKAASHLAAPAPASWPLKSQTRTPARAASVGASTVLSITVLPWFEPQHRHRATAVRRLEEVEHRRQRHAGMQVLERAVDDLGDGARALLQCHDGD